MKKTPALMLLVLAFGTAASQEREVFQVTFGSRAYLGQRAPVTDGGEFLVEAGNGDIVVAGYGGSTFTDTGNRIKPMIARIDLTGHVIWRQIYDDLQDHSVVGLVTHNGRQFAAFKQDLRWTDAELAPRQRISLREVDADGNLSRELGNIDDLYVSDIVPYRDNSGAGFLVTAIVTSGASIQRAFQRDISLFDLQVSGNVRRPKFPEGVKGARLLQRDAAGGLFFLRLAEYFSQAMGLVRLSPGGELAELFVLNDEVLSPMQLIATDSRVYLFEAVNRRNGFVPVTAFTRDGQEIWRKEIQGLSRFGQSIQQGDDLLIAGSYEGNPVIIKLDQEGHRVWIRRFRSAKSDAHIARMAILSDGWLAVTGYTGPGGGAFVSTDSDAFLGLADPDGDGFDEFGACMAAAAVIEVLREELADRAGLEVQREVLMTGRRARPVEELPPLNEPLAREMDCGVLSEHDLLRFLQEAADETRLLDLSKPSERSRIHIHLRASGVIPDPGYREWGRRGAGSEPSLEVGEDSARGLMRHLAEEVLPYTERMLAVTGELRARSGIWVGEARGYGSGLPPFSVNTVVAERFLELFLALSPDDRQAVRSRIGNHPMVVSADPDALHLRGENRIIVGRNRIDEVFDFLLVDLPEIQRQIEQAGQRVLDELGFSVTKSSGIPHIEFLDIVRRIDASLDDLGENDRATIRNVGPVVNVSRNMTSDIFMPGYRQQITITPVAADKLLEFILQNADEIRKQPYDSPR